MGCVHVKPPDPALQAPTAESIALFGAPREFPRVNLALPSYELPFRVELSHITQKERDVARQQDKEALLALSEEEKRALFNVADVDEVTPAFYNKNTNQCPMGGPCYEAHKIG